MDILENIKDMVDSAYEQVIEGEGIYSDFEDANIEISSVDFGKFLDTIPNETTEKWKKRMRKKTLRDLLTNSPDDYMIDIEGGSITWKNREVNDWQMQFFCEKLVKYYKKKNKVLSPLETFYKANEHAPLKRFNDGNPMNNVEEYCFLLLRELLREEYLLFATGWGEITPERQDDFIQNWIDKLNSVY